MHEHYPLRQLGELMFRKFFRQKYRSEPTPLGALLAVRAAVERKNISFPFDDVDVGYDMAIDEVLGIIDEAINQISSENDVDYSGGL